MHRLMMVISAVALLACRGSAWAIDCKHAHLPAQQVACSSPELIKVLAERDRAFAEARSRVKGKELKALVTDERDWIRDYPKTCDVPATGTLPTPIAEATVACFKRASEARITYLRQYGRPKSAAAGPASPSESTAAPSPPPEAAPTTVEESALPPTKKPASPALLPPASKPAVAAVPPSPALTAAPPAAAGAPPAPLARDSAGTAQYHLKFTFACSNPGELPKVTSSLAANDLSYPLSRPDCLPVPDGGTASLLSLSGKIAKIRMCTADVGCTDVYIDANSVLDAEGRPAAK